MELRERVARYAHDAWCRWVKVVMVEEQLSDSRRVRWQRLAFAPFDDLTDREKKPDYVEADRILALCSADVVRREREAFVAGAEWMDDEDCWIGYASAEALRRYPEGGKQ